MAAKGDKEERRRVREQAGKLRALARQEQAQARAIIDKTRNAAQLTANRRALRKLADKTAK